MQLLITELVCVLLNVDVFTLITLHYPESLQYRDTYRVFFSTIKNVQLEGQIKGVFHCQSVCSFIKLGCLMQRPTTPRIHWAHCPPCNGAVLVAKHMSRLWLSGNMADRWFDLEL